ncbi:MAG: hypothetical protein ACOY4I_02570 [Bacillota bacterium]
MINNKRVLGMKNINTPLTLKISGIPNMPFNNKIYLILYALEKEKYRLVQEISMYDKKRLLLQKRVDYIKAKIAQYKKLKMNC